MPIPSGSRVARARRASDILGVDPWAYTLDTPWSAMRKAAQGKCCGWLAIGGDCYSPDGGVGRVSWMIRPRRAAASPVMVRPTTCQEVV